MCHPTAGVVCSTVHHHMAHRGFWGGFIALSLIFLMVGPPAILTLTGRWDPNASS